MNKKNKKTVFIGVSGGVDSSVSAVLLKEQGYDVIGVFIRTWTPGFINCTWQDERRDAMRVCSLIGIPFLECDAEKAYKKEVVDYMIEEYKKGNTPNPDVMCNREIKFGVFWDFAKKHKADYIATGHYSVVSSLRDNNSSQGSLSLYKGVDQAKDQSYFLWTLTQEDLANTLFPIGHLLKSEVRILAKKYKIPTATKKDSQGVCFLGPIDMKDFLKHYIKTKKGSVLNTEEEIIGFHEGAVFFTLGERHGFTITKHSNNKKPLYVVSKDIIKNTITVSQRLDHGKGKIKKIILCNKINWISEIPDKNKIYTAQIRYHGEFINCTVNNTNQTSVNIIFKNDVLVDSGQSIVVYDKDVCLGGGIVV